LGAVASLYFKFVGDMIDVVGGVFPIDILELGAFFVAVNGLFDRFTEGN
jgi:hypothetical protein